MAAAAQEAEAPLALHSCFHSAAAATVPCGASAGAAWRQVQTAAADIRELLFTTAGVGTAVHTYIPLGAHTGMCW